jgi:hypothetical protein
MNGTRSTWARRIGAAALLALSLVLAACSASKGSAPGAEASSAQAGYSSAKASIEANPTTAAELAQAKALVAKCFAGTPLQQIHQVHLVFASSATGKNGPAVVAARNTTLGCMGISPADRQPFTNDAITAAEHANPKLTTHDGRVHYFEVVLPGLVLKYSNAAPGGHPGASPSSTPAATPAPTATVTGSSA